MTEYYNNGFLVGDTGWRNIFATECAHSEGIYRGIHEFTHDPLYLSKDKDAKAFAVSKDKCIVYKGDPRYCDFITEPDILKTYIDHCKRLNMQIQLLFIQSTYDGEICECDLPEMSFL